MEEEKNRKYADNDEPAWPMPSQPDFGIQMRIQKKHLTTTRVVNQEEIQVLANCEQALQGLPVESTMTTTTMTTKPQATTTKMTLPKTVQSRKATTKTDGVLVRELLMTTTKTKTKTVTKTNLPFFT